MHGQHRTFKEMSMRTPAIGRWSVWGQPQALARNAALPSSGRFNALTGQLPFRDEEFIDARLIDGRAEAIARRSL